MKKMCFKWKFCISLRLHPLKSYCFSHFSKLNPDAPLDEGLIEETRKCYDMGPKLHDSDSNYIHYLLFERDQVIFAEDEEVYVKVPQIIRHVSKSDYITMNLKAGALLNYKNIKLLIISYTLNL